MGVEPLLQDLGGRSCPELDRHVDDRVPGEGLVPEQRVEGGHHPGPSGPQAAQRVGQHRPVEAIGQLGHRRRPGTPSAGHDEAPVRRANQHLQIRQVGPERDLRPGGATEHRRDGPVGASGRCRAAAPGRPGCSAPDPGDRRPRPARTVRRVDRHRTCSASTAGGTSRASLHRTTEEVVLIDRLGAPDALQLRRAVGGAHDHGHGRVMRLDDGRMGLDGGRPAGGDQWRRTARGQADPECQERGRPLVDVYMMGQAIVRQRGKCQRRAARPGGHDHVGDAGPHPLVDEGGRHRRRHVRPDHRTDCTGRRGTRG